MPGSLPRHVLQMTELSDHDSPDGELNIRARLTMSSYTYRVPYNGDCGIHIAPNPSRYGKLRMLICSHFASTLLVGC